MQTGNTVSYRQVNITGGFWAQKQRLNREATMPAVYERFAETGRIAAFDCAWREGQPHRPHIFWDSDVAKWMEAAAYVVDKHPDPALTAKVEALIDRIEQNQGADGYFNIFHTVVEPENRWKDRSRHELYCAGHLIEAAVAWYEAGRGDRFLRCMRRYADYIQRVFQTERSAAFQTPGHEEIELALVRLYRATGERRYLELALWFVDRRGDPPGPINLQDHLPVREQRDAEGHAVRAMYLYCAMADLALETGDRTLLDACRVLFESVTRRRMYVTGGIGQVRKGEAFSKDYYLPNSSAYAETCAAIGLALFASRMSALEADGVYADTAELALYNGFLSGLSLDGRSFFYENPLEMDGTEPERAVGLRQAVFSCSCCPPNINRILAGLGNFLYTSTADALYVQQYMESAAALEVGGKQAEIEQATGYPHEGEISLRVRGLEGKTLYLRIPGWCEAYTLTLDGRAVDTPPERGYVGLPVTADSRVELTLAMPPRLVEANPAVHQDAGRAALMRGPLVYCLEESDNGPDLADCRVESLENPEMAFDPFPGAYAITLAGSRRPKAGFEGALYRTLRPSRVPQKLRFIPYYAFANRGEQDMLVWVSHRLD